MRFKGGGWVFAFLAKVKTATCNILIYDSYPKQDLLVAHRNNYEHGVVLGLRCKPVVTGQATVFLPCAMAQLIQTKPFGQLPTLATGLTRFC